MHALLFGLEGRARKWPQGTGEMFSQIPAKNSSVFVVLHCFALLGSLRARPQRHGLICIVSHCVALLVVLRTCPQGAGLISIVLHCFALLRIVLCCLALELCVALQCYVLPCFAMHCLICFAVTCVVAPKKSMGIVLIVRHQSWNAVIQRSLFANAEHPPIRRLKELNN